MATTIIYTVSTFNETPINNIIYKGVSRLQADLTLQQAINNGKHGAILQTVIKENAQFSFYKEDTQIIKNF